MTKEKNKVICLVICVLLLLSGCKTDTPIIGSFVGLESNEIFQVDDLICTDAEYKLALMNYQNIYKKDLGGITDWNIALDEETTLEEYVKEKVKADITVKYTLAAMATSKGIVITSEEQSKIIEAAANYYSSLNAQEKEYTAATQLDVENLFKNYYMAEKVYNNLTDPVGTSITDEEARVIKIQYIKMNSSNTKESTIRRVMKDVTDLVYGGYQQFSREAKQYTEEEIIEKTIKKNEAKAKYEIEAFNLAKDEISSIIQEGNDFYLVYCVDNYIEDATAKNKDSIIKNEKQTYFNKQYNQYIAEIKTDFNTKAWNDLELSTDTNVANTTLDVEYEKIKNDK